MSGPDLTGAAQACHAARDDIREMQAEDDKAKAHFEIAQKEAKYADQAKTAGDAGHAKNHKEEATKEENESKAASQRAEQHGKDAFQHLGDYYAKMGRDPRKGIPPMGKDGPDCKPIDDAIIQQELKKKPGPKPENSPSAEGVSADH
jgi:hypothetical protein